MSTNPISEELLAEMLAGLEGVTPGPWQTVGNSITDFDREWQGSMSMEFIPNGLGEDGVNERHDQDAAHIARCDPDTIRAILTELRDRRAADSRANQAVVDTSEARKRVYAKLAEEGGGTWATYMYAEIEEAFAALGSANQAVVDDQWRGLALQFDGHRIEALGHIRALLDGPGHEHEAREFLHRPPLSGEAVLTERLAALSRAEGQEPVAVNYAETVAPYAAAIRMVREAVGELFGPMADLESEDAVLLRGPEPHHDAEALIAALQRIRSIKASAQEPVAVKPLRFSTSRVFGFDKTRAFGVFGEFDAFARDGMTAEQISAKQKSIQAAYDDVIRSALVKAPALAVPDGWKLVPIEPTGEWLSRSRHWIDRYAAGIDDEPQLDRIYSELPTPSQPLVRGEGE